MANALQHVAWESCLIEPRPVVTYAVREGSA